MKSRSTSCRPSQPIAGVNIFNSDDLDSGEPEPVSKPEPYTEMDGAEG